MGVTLRINVTNITETLSSFDVIRIKRAITGIDGTYLPITDNAPAPAAIIAPLLGNYSVSAKTLTVKFDQDLPVDILFTGVNPLTVPQVVDQINTAVGNVVASDSSNRLLLTSITDGTGSVVEIIGGSAAIEFGWTGGERSTGKDAHIDLQAGISAYNFTDKEGISGYFYKAQYANTVSNLSSEDSAPFEGDVDTLISAGNLSVVKVDLVDGRGIAVARQDITFYSLQDNIEVEGYQVGLTRAPLVITTDNAGHGEITLVRGLHVKVVFEGTSLIRNITIPDAPETILLDEMSNSKDLFDIADIPFNVAPRRSL